MSIIHPTQAEIASLAEAQAGTASDKFMTPERTADAIAALGGGGGGGGGWELLQNADDLNYVSEVTQSFTDHLQLLILVDQVRHRSVTSESIGVYSNNNIGVVTPTFSNSTYVSMVAFVSRVSTTFLSTRIFYDINILGGGGSQYLSRTAANEATQVRVKPSGSTFDSGGSIKIYGLADV